MNPQQDSLITASKKDNLMFTVFAMYGNSSRRSSDKGYAPWFVETGAGDMQFTIAGRLDPAEYVKREPHAYCPYYGFCQWTAFAAY